MGRRIKEWCGGDKRNGKCVIFGAFVVQHTRAQKKLYGTRMSVFCMEQKIQHRNVGGGEEEATTSSRELFLTVKLPSGRDSGSWWFQWLGGCWFVSFSWGDTHTQTVPDAENQPTNQPTPSAHTCNKDVFVYTGKSCCGCCCDIYFSSGSL
jgi:hypothetical protein